MSRRLPKFTFFLLGLSFITIIIMMVGLPWFLKYYFRWTFDQYMLSKSYRTFVIVFLYFNGFCGLGLLQRLMLILKSVTLDPFVQTNVKFLKQLSCFAILMAFSFLIKCTLYFTPFTLICCFILIICALFALVLAQVFAQAIAYKLENDLTI